MMISTEDVMSVDNKICPIELVEPRPIPLERHKAKNLAVQQITASQLGAKPGSRRTSVYQEAEQQQPQYEVISNFHWISDSFFVVIYGFVFQERRSKVDQAVNQQTLVH